MNKNIQGVDWSSLELSIDPRVLDKLQSWTDDLHDLQSKAVTILDVFIPLLQKEIEEYNQELAERDLPFFRIENLDNTLDVLLKIIQFYRRELINILVSEHRGKEKKVADRLFDYIIGECERLKSAIGIHIQPVDTQKNDEEDWEEHKLRLEQQFLLSDEIKELFAATARQISDICWSGHAAEMPKKIYIVYAWPEKKAEWAKHEKWIQPFLVGLRIHLYQLGFATLLDIKDNPPGNNINQYMQGAAKADYVLLIGTRSLLLKQQEGGSPVCQELNILHQSGKIKKNRVFPLLLSGEFDDAFPPWVYLNVTVKGMKGSKCYLDHLKWMINAFLGVYDADIFGKEWKALEAGVKKAMPDIDPDHDPNTSIFCLAEKPVKERMEKEKQRNAQHLRSNEANSRAQLNSLDKGRSRNSKEALNDKANDLSSTSPPASVNEASDQRGTSSPVPSLAPAIGMNPYTVSSLRRNSQPQAEEVVPLESDEINRIQVDIRFRSKGSITAQAGSEGDIKVEKEITKVKEANCVLC